MHIYVCFSQLLEDTDVKNNNKLFCKKKKLCVWRCPIEHTKTFFSAKCKMQEDFLVLYCKIDLFKTTSVHVLGKNLKLVKKIFMDVEKKIINHFAKKMF